METHFAIGQQNASHNREKLRSTEARYKTMIRQQLRHYRDREVLVKKVAELEVANESLRAAEQPNRTATAEAETHAGSSVKSGDKASSKVSTELSHLNRIVRTNSH